MQSNAIYVHIGAKKLTSVKKPPPGYNNDPEEEKIVTIKPEENGAKPSANNTGKTTGKVSLN